MGALQNDHRYFKGRVCCLQVYNTALNEQEIIAMQNRTFWFWHRGKHKMIWISMCNQMVTSEIIP